MRLRPLIAPPVVLSLLPTLTGCHLSRIPSPALSMAGVALSAGGLLGTYLLITLGAKYGRSMDTVSGFRNHTKVAVSWGYPAGNLPECPLLIDSPYDSLPLS
jgi:hypothetical protein